MNQTMNIMLPASANEVKGIQLHFIPSHILQNIPFVQNFKKVIFGGKKSKHFDLAEILKLHVISEGMWFYLLSSLAFLFVAFKPQYLDSILSVEMCH